MTSPTYGHLFSDALVSEIKAEMGRRDLSSRALGRLISKSSQYMSDRLDGGSAKTGRRVTLSVQDLAAISDALGLLPSDLTFRAHFIALGGDPNLNQLEAARARRESRREEMYDLPAVARTRDADTGEDGDAP